MNTDKYKLSLYAIIIVIIAVVGIQTYWNFFNYQSNKQQLINDVQSSLDNAVDTYYNEQAEKNSIGFLFNDNDSLDFLSDGVIDSIAHRIDLDHNNLNAIDSIQSYSGHGLTIFNGKQADSLLTKTIISTKQLDSKIKINKSKFNSEGERVSNLTYKIPESLKNRFLKGDSLNFNKLNNINDTITINDISNIDNQGNLKFLTSKVVISITSDSIPLKKLDTILNEELARKNIDIEYGLKFIKKDSSVSTLNDDIIKTASLSSESKSSFLPRKTHLSIYFQNVATEILYRSLSGIIISILLILAVVGILFYLLKIIRDQKELAAMKNDLISNITHEFKTPIATVGVAIESMQDFNTLDDRSKTHNYLEMSKTQLSKLNLMVEKLLETASLDSENLKMNYEELNMVDLINSIVENHKIQSENKQLEFKPENEDIVIKGDAFHLENAISNIIDNAVKYGGDKIEIELLKKEKGITITIRDNGSELSKNEAQKIFDKFYRVPKGNTHDVKGFGIGLYYTKIIIEKHLGSILVDVRDGTTFKINLPHG